MELLEIIAILISIISSTITVVVLILEVYPAFHALNQQERSLQQQELSLRNQERSLRFDVYYRVIEMMEKTRETRHEIAQVQPERVVDYFNSLKAKEKQEAFDEVARTFDKLGILVEGGVVPLQFVLDFYSRPLVITWNHMKANWRSSNGPMLTKNPCRLT